MTPFNLLLVLATLVPYILASPLPPSTDTVIPNEHTSSLGINTTFNSLNKRKGPKAIFSDELFLGFAFITRVSDLIVGFHYATEATCPKGFGHSEKTFPFEKLSIPWKKSLVSKEDLYLIPNTKLANTHLEDPQFNVGVSKYKYPNR